MGLKEKKWNLGLWKPLVSKLIVLNPNASANLNGTKNQKEKEYFVQSIKTQILVSINFHWKVWSKDIINSTPYKSDCKNWVSWTKWLLFPFLSTLNYRINWMWSCIIKWNASDISRIVTHKLFQRETWDRQNVIFNILNWFVVITYWWG